MSLYKPAEPFDPPIEKKAPRLPPFWMFVLSVFLMIVLLNHLNETSEVQRQLAAEGEIHEGTITAIEFHPATRRRFAYYEVAYVYTETLSNQSIQRFGGTGLLAREAGEGLEVGDPLPVIAIPGTGASRPTQHFYSQTSWLAFLVLVAASIAAVVSVVLMIRNLLIKPRPEPPRWDDPISPNS